MRILIVDDDPLFRRLVFEGLNQMGHETTAAEGGQQALEAVEAAPKGHFDLLLLDIEMPVTSGWDVLASLREAGNEVPVIFLSGLQSSEEKVKSLELGADDYVVKPVDMPELGARIEAVARRRDRPTPVEYGELRLDLGRREVARDGTPVELSPREFDLLLVLVRAKGEIVSRQELLEKVWHVDADADTNVLDVHIGRLRKKIDRLGRPLIHNERGKGYHIAVHTP